MEGVAQTAQPYLVFLKQGPADIAVQGVCKIILQILKPGV